MMRPRQEVQRGVNLGDPRKIGPIWRWTVGVKDTKDLAEEVGAEQPGET